MMPTPSGADGAVVHLCDITRAILGADRVTVWLYDETARTVSVSRYVSQAVSQAPSEDPGPGARSAWRSTHIPLSDFPAAQEVLVEGRTIIIDDPLNDPRVPHGLAQELDLTSLHIEPLVVGRPVGMLAIEPAIAASGADLDAIIPLVAMSVSQGIAWNEAHEGRAEADAARSAQQRTASALRSLLTEGSRAVSIGQACEVLARVMRDAVDAQYAAVLLRDDEGRVGEIVTVGVHPAYVDELRKRLGGKPFEDFALWQQITSEPAAAFVEDGGLSRLLPANLAGRFSLGSYVAIPLLSGSGALGVVICANPRPARWTDEQRELIAQLTLEGSLVVENAALRAAERERMIELAHQAFHDALTGLPNRILFLDRLDHALLRAGRRKGSVAVLFLDLDGFKAVNDDLGHEAGDELLVDAARQLEECLRPEDTVARLGGDEFTILLEEIEDVSDAVFVATRLVERFQQPFVLRDQEIFITSSVGIALSGEGALESRDLLRNADLAMYRAKNNGKSRYEIFNSEYDEPALGRLELETALRKVVESNQLRVHYQPMVCMTSGNVVALEALVRWEHPERGLMKAGEFVPMSERSGLVVTIGSWVLEEACRQLRAWQDASPAETPPLIWVNLSARQFQRADIVTEVAQLLTKYNIKPACLGLEITESMLVEDVDMAAAVLHALKALGVQLSIDDFGTGYASLSYLRRFPFDTLKIDQSFVADLADHDNAAIVRAIIMLAHAIGRNVIAEGVETTEQFIDLRELGCEVGQGYYFAKPLPAEEVDLMLAGSPLSVVRAASA